ncbi:MAG: DUF4430 domain-containing protein [Patescibacteria group bacterium]|nr:DUF4430 domain-containing protein [Patescibacteria group bacterium]
MRRNIKIIIAVIIFLSLGILGWQNIHKQTLGRSVSNEQKNFLAKKFLGESENILPTQLKTADIEVNGVKYQTEISQNTSVYDFMDKLRTEGKINFEDKTYVGMGKFIESINGIKNTGDKSWIYYVNGKEAQIGVSNYKMNPGDVVSWKYEKGY